MSALDTIISALNVVLPNFRRSNGTIEAKIIDVVGTFADTEIIERQNTLEEIQNALANQRVTTKEYYRRKSVAFQVGDTIMYDPVNQGAYYPEINPENQIIKQAYIIGDYPSYTLLVNALDSNGHLRRLTQTELNSFRTYFQAFQPLGLELNINSLDVAQITDPGLIVYVRAGTDAGAAVSAINASFLAYEATLRQDNVVTLSEIEDIIQSYPGVRAIGWGNPTAREQQLDGSVRVTSPVAGVFDLINGAFTFATTITTDMVKILQ